MFDALKAKIISYDGTVDKAVTDYHIALAWAKGEIGMFKAIGQLISGKATAQPGPTVKACADKTCPICNPTGQPLDVGRSAGSTTSPATQVSGVNVTSNPNPIGQDRIS